MSKTKDVREAVEAELSFDPLVDATDITVKNMNGEVALNGTVPSYPQYVEAAAAAERVAGVKKVYNHLEVVLLPGDSRDDATLTTMANDALTLNVTVPDGVEATAKNDNITLTGSVSYGSERAAAELTVAALTGVRGTGDHGPGIPDARRARRRSANRRGPFQQEDRRRHESVCPHGRRPPPARLRETGRLRAP
jgi:BON domain-containing protein